ncbi:YbaN family protein, partial [Gordonibacter pamelaeae]
AVLPIVPTTPFLLAAAFCFARSSERSRAWFRGTKLYRTVLAGYMSKRAMTVRAKVALLVPLTAVLAVSFALMGSVPVGRAVVAVVWAAHLVYFGLVVKTDRGPSEGALAAAAPLGTDGEGA